MPIRRLPALVLFACLLAAGCRSKDALPAQTVPSTPPEQAQAANREFLRQKEFDPWILSTSDLNRPIDAYLANGRVGFLIRKDGKAGQRCEAGRYNRNALVVETYPPEAAQPDKTGPYRQTLDLRTGVLTTMFVSEGKETTWQTQAPASLGKEGAPVVKLAPSGSHAAPILPFWRGRDIVIEGDPEAQQVTHANLFYLLSSTYPGSDHSIPPMGLSSRTYNGHIFWDADVWMLPALLVQWPEYARSIVDYRFKTLGQAQRNARQHGYQGAEFPWESAATGAEAAPAEFARERHVTAGVAFAAWQYYLWTGDRTFLAREGWPLLQATAQYWVSRVTQGKDGKYHIRGVLSPDETAGLVDDDAYTNAAARYNLRAALAAARLLHRPAEPQWTAVAERLFLPFDKQRAIPAASALPLTDHYAAKQAAALLLIHPLGADYDAATMGRMLDFYAAHTIKTGPAMTASIHAIVAARLGRSQQSLDYFREAYRPFMRAPWDAFSEKRTTQNVYFLTGMAGCVQSALYGFAGLRVSMPGEKVSGTRIAGDAEAVLYADPHLPPGWEKLILRGVRFRGKSLEIAITAPNRVTVASR
ncbi:MAG TPA: hypothetical protein VFB38_03820 [Chthonomonadaceae bacterium]|nr:hypothetical protein [Chthonomonadaceae bacterium]